MSFLLLGLQNVIAGYLFKNNKSKVKSADLKDEKGVVYPKINIDYLKLKEEACSKMCSFTVLRGGPKTSQYLA